MSETMAPPGIAKSISRQAITPPNTHQIPRASRSGAAASCVARVADGDVATGPLIGSPSPRMAGRARVLRLPAQFPGVARRPLEARASRAFAVAPVGAVARAEAPAGGEGSSRG